MIVLTKEQREILGTLSIIDRFAKGEFSVLKQKIFDAHSLIAPQYELLDMDDIKILYLHFEEYSHVHIVNILHYNHDDIEDICLEAKNVIEHFTYFSGHFSNEQIKRHYDATVKPIILFAAEKLSLVLDIENEREPEEKREMASPGKANILIDNYRSLIRKLYDAVQWAEEHDSPIDGIDREYVDKHRDVFNTATRVPLLNI